MKRMVLGIAAASLVAGVAHGQEPKIATGFAYARAPLEAKTLKGAPYSAETVNEFVQVLSDGNRIVRKTTGRVYRDSEGRIRREEDRPSGSPSISITDPVAGVSYSLDPERRIAWKTPSFAGTILMSKMDEMKLTVKSKIDAAAIEQGDHQPGARPVAPTTMIVPGDPGPVTVEINGGRIDVRLTADSGESRDETLPSKVVEGVVADGRRTTKTIAAGAVGNERAITIVAEEWTSPELHVLVFTEHKDPRNGDSVYRLLNINRAEPSSGLFEVPAGYTIRETGIRKFEHQ